MPSKKESQARGLKQPRTMKKGRSRARLPQSEHRWEIRRTSLAVLREVRLGTSLTAASKQYGIKATTVRRDLPWEFSKPSGSRRYVASKADHVVRELHIIGDKGMIPIKVRGSRAATRLAKYLVAAHKAVTNEDPKALAEWQGKRIAGHKLITSLRQLMLIAPSGALSFEDLYAPFSVGAA
jgi:hypothetical protein